MYEWKPRSGYRVTELDGERRVGTIVSVKKAVITVVYEHAGEGLMSATVVYQRDTMQEHIKITPAYYVAPPLAVFKEPEDV